MAAVGAVGQALAVLASSVPIELLLLGVTSLATMVIVGIVAATAFELADAYDDDMSDTINAVGSVSSIVGMCLMAAGALCAALEMLREARKEPRGRRAASSADDEAVELNEMLPLSIGAGGIGSVLSLPPSSFSSSTSSDDVSIDVRPSVGNVRGMPRGPSDSLDDVLGLGPPLTAAASLPVVSVLPSVGESDDENAFSAEGTRIDVQRRQKRKGRAGGAGVEFDALPLIATNLHVSAGTSAAVPLTRAAGVIRLPPRETATTLPSVNPSSPRSAQMAEHWLAVLEDAQAAADAAGGANRKGGAA